MRTYDEAFADALTVAYGEIVIQRTAPVLTVMQSPPRSRITLGLIQHSDPDLLFISGARLYLGNDPDGREVAYRVTGWDAEAEALIIDRISPVED